MGAIVGTVEGYGEMFRDSIVQTSATPLCSTKQIGNPVVYKLVRVAVDGRLVPATDEEILEVKDLLENNENDMPILTDSGQTLGYTPGEGSPSQLLQIESLEGLFQSETAEAYASKLNSRLESKEEFMHGSQMISTLLDPSIQSSTGDLSGNETFLQEPTHLSSHWQIGCSRDQSIDVVPYSNATGSPKETALSNAPQKPDFSEVKGEICLDKLSIKELQETFRVTFGRETTVKDKLWLKRRIAMGLINSCVVPTTSLIFKDNKLVVGQENYNGSIDDLSKNMTDEQRATNCKDVPSSPDYIKGHSNASRHSPFETFGDHYSGNEEFEGEHRAAKRVRKPTKRYIEEVAGTDEKQLCDESMIPLKDQRIFPKSQADAIRAVSSGGRVVVTRMVSLAGSKIEVPYVSHVRRSRPRENIMALGEFHSSSWENKAIPAESNLNLSPSQLNNDVNRVSVVRPASGSVRKECVTDCQTNNDNSKPIFTDVDQETEPEHIDSSGDSSDDNCTGVPITQGGIRRKHHRAWTLSEVTKLVEGVAKYGVGKWSEIKRFSFSSSSYRTSVDLKDKWRNLRKASFSQTPSNKMGSIRKHGSMAIPAQILLQVRELVEKQLLVSPVSKATGDGNSTRMVKESRNGFL